jgi:UPF0755 protein
MKLNNSISIKIGTFFFVALLVSSGAWLWWHDAIAPVDPSDTSPVIFVIHTGEGVKSIASRLSEQHLIRSATGFFVLVKALGIETQLQAGDFRIVRTMNTRDIAQELTHGTLDAWVTTLEGWRDEEIATKLAKDLDIPETEFLKYASQGYMFPDTYLIPRDATAAAIVALFNKTFNEKVTPQMKTDALKQGLTFNEVLTLASIVEREGKTDADRPVIAGILLKRLKAGWPLQADATLQYALGYQSAEKSWWKKYLSDDDKTIKSPYNTYKNTGLPPGPIANPGLSSIRAVIYPTQSDYWYYLHDTKGQAHYAKTVQEHTANIDKFL